MQEEMSLGKPKQTKPTWAIASGENAEGCNVLDTLFELKAEALHARNLYVTAHSHFCSTNVAFIAGLMRRGQMV